MRIAIKTAAVALAAAGMLAAGGTAAQADAPGPASGTAEVTAPDTRDTDTTAKKVYKNVWHTASSYYDPYFETKTGGKLYAGKNYFFCQESGVTLKAKGYENNWWLKTDDDSGNADVWVNAIFIKGGSNNTPVKGVPVCTY